MLEYIDIFPSRRVAVIGDVMLDGYVWGRAGRISPEAPVPVVEVNKVTSCLGGAANVIRNLVSLGGQAAAFGVVGNDLHGEKLRSLLDRSGIDPVGVFTDPSRPTTFKERIIAVHCAFSAKIDSAVKIHADSEQKRKVQKQ